MLTRKQKIVKNTNHKIKKMVVIPTRKQETGSHTNKETKTDRNTNQET